MAERPILMSAPMVRALLEGRKTQTLRIIKLIDPPPHQFPEATLVECWHVPDGLVWAYPGGEHVSCRPAARCPYGKPGDRLWVRETWLPCCHGSYEAWPRNGGTPVDAQQAFIQYKEDAPIDDYKGFWRSSIHMPRWASRFTLEITEVRVQRLQEISKEDVVAEGVKAQCVYCRANDETCSDGSDSCSGEFQYSYMQLWESINGGVGSWDLNPWVWAISFKEVAA
jgi:hypothetical protein